MGKNKKNVRGQALLFVILVVFIMFFMVLSLSSTVNTNIQTVLLQSSSEKSLLAASSGIIEAIKYIQTTPVTSPVSSVGCNLSITYTQYVCSYNIFPQTNINEYVNADQPIQLNMSGAIGMTISYSDPSSFLVINTITNFIPTTTSTCIYYPSFRGSTNIAGAPHNPYMSFRNYILDASGGKVDMNNFGNSLYGPIWTQKCSNAVQNGNPDPNYPNDGYQNLYKSGGFYTLPNSGNSPYDNGGTDLIDRVFFINYSGNKIQVKINITYPTGVIPNVQQYEITSTGSFAGSRRIVQAYIAKNGSAPGIFDYSLFNGGNTSITF